MGKGFWVLAALAALTVASVPANAGFSVGVKGVYDSNVNDTAADEEGDFETNLYLAYEKDATGEAAFEWTFGAETGADLYAAKSELNDFYAEITPGFTYLPLGGLHLFLQAPAGGSTTKDSSGSYWDAGVRAGASEDFRGGLALTEYAGYRQTWAKESSDSEKRVYFGIGAAHPLPMECWAEITVEYGLVRSEGQDTLAGLGGAASASPSVARMTAGDVREGREGRAGSQTGTAKASSGEEGGAKWRGDFGLSVSAGYAPKESSFSYFASYYYGQTPDEGSQAVSHVVSAGVEYSF